MNQKSSYLGVTLKSLLLLFLVILSAFASLKVMSNFLKDFEWGYVLITFVSLAISVFCYFLIGRQNSKTKSIICSLIHVFFLGISLGTVSALFELYFPGIVSVCVFSTIIIFLVFLTLFITGLFKINSKFLKFLSLFSLVLIVITIYMLIVSIKGFTDEVLTILIVLESIIVIFTTLELYQDFEYVKNEIDAGCEKSYEWQLSVHLLMGLINLYVEILRLVYFIFEKKKR